MSTRSVYFPFDEQRDTILPRDKEGNGQSELIDATVATPPVVADNAMGNGRQFDTTNGFVLEDSNAAGSTREVGAVVMGAFDYASHSNGDHLYIISHGEVAGAVVYHDWALRLEMLDVAAGVARLRAVWHDDSLAAVVPDGVLVQLPSSGEVLLGFTRFQEDDTIKVRYFVGDRFSDAIVSPAVDPFDIYTAIADADSRLWVGAVDDGTGGVTSGMHGIITNAVVTADEIAGEEVALFWKSVSTIAEAARAAMYAYKPAKVYSRDPGTRINRELRNEAGAFAYMKGTLEEIRVASFPRWSFGSWLERWETMLRISPKPTDSIGERRERVLAHTRNLLGTDIDSIQLQLRELYGFDADDDVEIIEAGPVMTEDWATDQTENYLVLNSTATISHDGVSERLDFNRPGPGAADSRYRGILDNGVSSFGATMALWPVRGAQNRYLRVEVDIEAFAQNAAEHAGAGIVIGNRVDDEWLFIGCGYLSAGADEVGYWHWKNGAFTFGTPTIIGSGLTFPLTLTVFYADGVYDITADDGSVTRNAGSVIGPLTPEWVGLHLSAPPDQTGNDAMSAEFDNLTVVDYNGTQALNWFAYRDPLLSTEPYNLDKAQKLIDRIEHANTRGRAIDNKDGINVEDSGTLTSRNYFGKV